MYNKFIPFTSESEKIDIYLKESSKTLSGKFYYDSINSSEPDVFHYSTLAIKACKELDLIKKKKFYNKEVNITSSVPSNLKFTRDDNGENTLHAAIGLVTEAGEILEAIMKQKYENQTLDVVNIKEELGDLMWYMAILLRDHNIDLFDAMDINIKKLRARYGEKFSTEKANNRNLNLERTILEDSDLKSSNVIERNILLSPSHTKEQQIIANALNATGITKEETDNRKLENGGLAPLKEWKSITELNLDKFTKSKIIEEMREMKERGETVTSTYKQPMSIYEFTQPFKYLEEINNYSGSFLVNLLKSEFEIDAEEKKLKIDLSQRKKECINGDVLLLSIYDIKSSTDKKFIVVLKFDKINGLLCHLEILMPDNKIANLSTKQEEELSNFYKIKQIVQSETR